MLIKGDSKLELKQLKKDSVDLLCTDPPYGISFMQREWDKVLPDIEIWKECLRVLKPGAFAFVMCAPRQDVLSRMIIMLEDAGFETGFTSMYWTYATGFPKAHNISKAVDKKLGNVRKVVRQKKLNRKDKKAYMPNKFEGMSGSSTFKGNPDMMFETEAASDEAKKLDGAYGGFQPKPAVEVVIVAMKPCEKKTYMEQALDNCKGITWLDDCRVPYGDDKVWSADRGTVWSPEKQWNSDCERSGSDKGRFPANLLISGNALDDGRVSKGGKPSLRKAGQGRGILGQYDGRKTMPIPTEDLVMVNNYGDEGTYSRFFSLDKWAEQNLPFLIVPKATKKEKDIGLDGQHQEKVNDGRKKEADNAFQRGASLRKNTHPTVKPLKLMSYLITMGSRKGDVVLDPFAGTGTTGIAAINLGRKYIMIEKDADYYEIGKARIRYMEEPEFMRLIKKED